MRLNKKWGYGQLFGFSGLEGPNRYYEDHILMSMSEKLTFRYEFFPEYVLLKFPLQGKITINAFMSDFVLAHNEESKFSLAFLDNDTLAGSSPVLPVFEGQREMGVSTSRGATIYSLGKHHFGLRYVQKQDGSYDFVIHHSFSQAEARSGANYYIEGLDVDSLIAKYRKYYLKKPKCLDKKYEELYYKALSIQKVNVHTAEGKIQRLWTTPDRVPHRHMWMWDSAFHALAMVQYNQKAAKEIFLAMLEQTREDGFMPHMANPTDRSDVTQPCVMSFTALKIYEVTKDKKFLREAVKHLEKYLTYITNNRDENGNHLLEWFTEPEYTSCKCGESGLDNSPRFDFDEKMDCVDFSSYYANDTESLARIYEILGEEELSKKWMDLSNLVKKTIQELLYDEEDGVYYDRLFSGKLTKVLTPSSFLPMLSGIPSKEQAKRMVEVFLDKSLLYSEVPLASISQKDPRFSNDMWRGGVWININYLTILCLRRYGYIEEAEELRDKTLEMVDKWYKKNGTIFEFYDPKNEVSPFMCERKGHPEPKPDYRKHVHSISDYNWSACFTMLLIQRIYYK